MIRASGAIGASPRRVSPPKGFAWDFETFPVNVFDSGKRYFKTDLDPKSKIPADIWNGPQYWVSHDGSDENSGLARKTPVASAWKARELAENNPDAAKGYSINVVPDPSTGLIFLDREGDFNDSANLSGKGSGQTSDRPFALACHGGRLVMGPCALFSYTLADTASNTWSANTGGSEVAAIYNVSGPGPFGVYARIPRMLNGVANDATALAAVQSAPGDAWAQAPGSGLLYVRLGNGTQVSNSSISVANNAYGLRLGSGDVYLSGIELVGGCIGSGAVDASRVASRTLVFEDVGAWGAGAAGREAIPAFGLDNMTGLAVLHRCYGYDALGDIFNFKGSEGQLHTLMIDCWGIDAGHAGAIPISYGNSVVHASDTARLITLNTQASYSAGGCTRVSGDAQQWDLGSIYAYDRGDQWLGNEGIAPPTGVRVDDDARYWGQDITVAGCEVSFTAKTSASIRLRSAIEIGGKCDKPDAIGEF